MFDRDPVMQWVYGRVALLGDAAHPPLQYMAQGAIMAIEDGWVLAEHVGAQGAQRTSDGSGVDWAAALAAYDAVRPEHCRRVLTTGRAWGELWHLDGIKREQRNLLLRARDTYDYSFTEWIYGPTALTPDQEPPLYTAIPLDSVTGTPAQV
jgi:salicylate hydroxylase